MNSCAILLDYRGAEKTGKCLESLLGQGLSTIYVVDNCDHPEWSARLKNTVAGFKTSNPGIDVRLISASANLGFAGGVNLAITTDISSPQPHDFFLLINNDAVAGPGLLAGLLKSLQEDRSVMLAAPCIRQQGAGEECGLWYNRYTGILSRHKLPLSFLYISGCCMLVDRRLAGDNGLFDPDFFMYGEDALFCWQLWKKGQPYKLVPGVYAEHAVGASSNKAGMFYEYHTTRGHVLMATKACHSAIEIPAMLLTKFVTLFIRSLFRCLTYRSLVPARAFFLAWLPLNIRIP
ncbi:MAG: glycosyltransferase [Thiogranum sp.]